MKRRCNIFAAPIVLFLCLLLPGTILAEQRDSATNIAVNNNIRPLENKRDRQQELTPAGSEPRYSQSAERREKGHRQIREDGRSLFPDGGDMMMDTWTKDRTYHTPHKKRIHENSDRGKTSADTWRIEAVDAPKYFIPTSRSLAVDARNQPHIAYGGDHLYYAYYDGSKWHYETADASSNVGKYASIALDKKGKAYISYYDSSNYYLRYATNASGTWVTTTVDSDGGEYPSLALDESGKAHISYYGDTNDDTDTNHDLKYATNASGTWVTTTVDSVSAYPYEEGYTSIAVDTSGKAHISYSDDGNLENDGNLKYATNAASITTPTPTPSPTVTPTPPECEAKSITAFPNKLNLTIQGSGDVAVTVTGKDDCLVEGTTVKATITSGKKRISVSPASQETDVNGQAVFTITAKDKTGNAKIVFKDGNLKTKVTVKVVD